MNDTAVVLLQSRWVLNYNQLHYSGKAYTPIAEEPFLRLRTGKLNTAERITVPILLIEHSDGEDCALACSPVHAHQAAMQLTNASTACCLSNAALYPF